MRAVVSVLLLSALVATACGDPAAVSDGASDTASEAPASEAADTGGGSDRAAVTVADSDLGMILVDGEGATLYLLADDNQGEPTCYDDCATSWPPVAGPVTAGDGADDALLGEVERSDGTVQATYNDWPLYYFGGDAQAGDVNGQGAGGVWFVLGADGEPVKEGEGDDAARDY